MRGCTTDRFAEVTKRGSRTYYTSSLLFPPALRREVFTLYAFVRTADDFVDACPQNEYAFQVYRKAAEKRFSGKELIIADVEGVLPGREAYVLELMDAFYALAQRKGIRKAWVYAFFSSMALDLQKRSYATLGELQEYMHGSAESVGLCMAQLMELPPQAHIAARALGSGMQLINFVRDVREDWSLGRTYLPQEDLVRFGIPSLEVVFDEQEQERYRDAFAALVRYEIERGEELLNVGAWGFSFIPKRIRVPVAMATMMYRRTARTIARSPHQVLQGKVRLPSRSLAIALFEGLWA